MSTLSWAATRSTSTELEEKSESRAWTRLRGLGFRVSPRPPPGPRVKEYALG